MLKMQQRESVNDLETHLTLGECTCKRVYNRWSARWFCDTRNHQFDIVSSSIDELFLTKEGLFYFVVSKQWDIFQIRKWGEAESAFLFWRSIFASEDITWPKTRVTIGQCWSRDVIWRWNRTSRAWIYKGLPT